MLRARELNHVFWWDVQAVNPERLHIYGIPHLKYTHESGVVDFTVPPASCQPLASYLDSPSSYDKSGWLVMAGRTYPGYAKYPYVHSRLGQVSSVQEVRAPPRTRPLPHTSGKPSDVSHRLPLPQRKTVRVSGKTACDFILEKQPEVRQLVEAVRGALGLPDSRRDPTAPRPAQPKGKCIRALHFLLQDAAEQASFTWHADAEDIGHKGQHMTTVIVSLSDECSGMRMWGFGPHLFRGMGSACAFAGAALHESLPKCHLLRPVRKVALFFA